jgi:hypothetical protein
MMAGDLQLVETILPGGGGEGGGGKSLMQHWPQLISVPSGPAAWFSGELMPCIGSGHLH